VLFANAGFVEPKLTAAVSPEHYDKPFDTNARGIFFAVQKALTASFSFGHKRVKDPSSFPDG
jgi:NAD(P)-dependent dehydrogenase (short-subunit alcohol dehydrogenase family)